MNSDDLAARMRAGECYHGMRVPPGAYIVVRADGRSFSRLTERLFEKPFDRKMHDHMIRAARALLEAMQGIYAFTESDEISVLLPRGADIFDREVEKLVSLSAGIASAHVSLGIGEPVEFDARIWVGARRSDVVDYFRWRQNDGTRCALHGYAYWMLRREGMSERQATKALEGASVSKKNEILFARGVNFNDTPTWQRRGTGIYWETYEKEGLNPRTGETTRAERRRIKVDEELPAKDAYERFLGELLPAEED
jgi:tRNA(His) 5'-end guanylyltransferase